MGLCEQSAVWGAADQGVPVDSGRRCRRFRKPSSKVDATDAGRDEGPVGARGGSARRVTGPGAALLLLHREAGGPQGPVGERLRAGGFPPRRQRRATVSYAVEKVVNGGGEPEGVRRRGPAE